MVTTLAEVAKAAGVEISTASKILAMEDQRSTRTWRGYKFSLATCRRVRAVAKRLGYRGGYLARWRRREYQLAF